MVVWAAIIIDDRILQTKLELSVIIMNESSLQKAIGKCESQVILRFSKTMTEKFHK